MQPTEGSEKARSGDIYRANFCTGQDQFSPFLQQMQIYGLRDPPSVHFWLNWPEAYSPPSQPTPCPSCPNFLSVVTTRPIKQR